MSPIRRKVWPEAIDGSRAARADKEYWKIARVMLRFRREFIRRTIKLKQLTQIVKDMKQELAQLHSQKRRLDKELEERHLARDRADEPRPLTEIFRDDGWPGSRRHYLDD